jgi:hypothetical protein
MAATAARFRGGGGRGGGDHGGEGRGGGGLPRRQQVARENSLGNPCCVQAKDHLQQLLLLPPPMFGHHAHDYRLMLRLLLREHRDCGHGC